MDLGGSPNNWNGGSPVWPHGESKHLVLKKLDCLVHSEQGELLPFQKSWYGRRTSVRGGPEGGGSNCDVK